MNGSLYAPEGPLIFKLLKNLSASKRKGWKRQKQYTIDLVQNVKKYTQPGLMFLA